MFLRSYHSPHHAQEAQPQAIQRLKSALAEADAVVIGAGSGLSTSAGFQYDGARFQRYFFDFAAQYGIRDIYSGGFYPYKTLEEYWGWWCRHIWVNRYMPAPRPVYTNLLELVRGKDYFVLTTNVDHQFQKAGFDRRRLFYTQGDYGLWQCMEPCCQKTYDNEQTVRKMVQAQGFSVAPDGTLALPEGTAPGMTVPTELVPHCPVCGRPLTMNLRSDSSFVEDEGWHQAAERYSEFLRRHGGQKVLFWELGVGANTPVIIKYPFWRYTQENPSSTYACVNFREAFAPREIAKRSICVDGDIGEVLEALR